VGYAFNVESQDVTLFDPATRRVLDTRPLGAQVRYLHNEQVFWDGRHIWTYDFPENKVRAIAIDPRTVSVARALPTGGTGPALSLMLTPDRRTAWVTIAGDDQLAVLDLASGQVVDRLPTGDFPCDLHFTPDGRYGFVPERDSDTVSKIDLRTRKIVQTVAFPAGSKPYMLRVTPDGREVWVQTAVTSTNAVLDAESMATLATAVLGKGPVTNAYQPGGPYSVVAHFQDTAVSVLDRRTGQEVKRIDVGGTQGTLSFAPDGGTVFVSVSATNEVVAIDMAQLEVVARIPTGRRPHGLVLLDPELGPVTTPSPPPTGSGGNLPGMPNTGGGGMGRGRRDSGGWLLTLGGAAVLAGLRLRARGGRAARTDYRRLDQDAS
jgi:YVTN family beta-propeller protein